MLDYDSTPIQKISNSILDIAGIQLLVKREDLNNNYISGNKWWKLKFNLEEAKKQITFYKVYKSSGGRWFQVVEPVCLFQR